MAASGLILPASVLSLPRFGCINVHASLLPRWRGAAPIERAIMAGDEETGVCIMQMEEGLDTGPVMAQQQISIEPGYTAQPLEQILADTGSELLLETLQNLPMAATPQAAEGATYANKLTSKDRTIYLAAHRHTIAQRADLLVHNLSAALPVNNAVFGG